MTRNSAPHRRDWIERHLDLYYDGELRGFRKWRFERLLRRNPGLRRELETRAQLGALLRESLPEPESPDLWAEIAGQIARTPQPEVPEASWTQWLQPWPLRVAPALAGAIAAVAFFVIPAGEDPMVQAQGVVRSIVSQGRPVVVLDDSEEATIIWFLDGENDASEEVSDGVRV